MRRIHATLSALCLITLGALGIAAGCSPSPPVEPPPPVATVSPPTGDATAPSGGATPPSDTAAPTSTGSATPPPPAGNVTIVPSKEPCKSDDDCVPATCCLATACTSASKAPDCSAVRCRRDCSKPTIECGGGCLCQNGFCAAKLGTSEE